MLPMFMTARRTLVAGLAAASITALPAAPAHAWGDREQGFVAGVAAAVIVDEILKRNRRARDVRPAPAFNFVERPAAVAATSSIYRTPAASAFNSYSAAERKAIQRKLRAYGYYRGGIDGSFGPGTYGAVLAYARDEGRSDSLGTSAGAYGVLDGLLY
jgi:hypothetical protein